MTLPGASSPFLPAPAQTETQPRILALVGMPGAGKTLFAHHLQARGFVQYRFGAITIAEVERQGLPVTPENERQVREQIRAREGMDAYARRLLPKIHDALARRPSVVLDGLYSFSEYKTLRAEFGDLLVLVAIACERRLRYARLAARAERPLTREEAEQRDVQEIEALEKGGPIAIADYTILNNGTPEAALAELDHLLERLGFRP